MREMAGKCSICVHGDTCYGTECNYKRKKKHIEAGKFVSKIKGGVHINKSGRMSWGVEDE